MVANTSIGDSQNYYEVASLEANDRCMLAMLLCVYHQTISGRSDHPGFSLPLEG